MKRLGIGIGLCFVATALFAEDSNWTRWRGSSMDGVAKDANPPIEWSEDKNVQWKVALPGQGSSTPIIWGEHIYILAAIPTDGSEAPLAPHANPNAPQGRRRRRGGPPPVSIEQEFKLLVLNRADGSLAWERTATKAVPHDGKQANNSYASASAMTDGEILLAYFNSWGLYAYDMEGNLKWSKDFGDLYTRGGFGEGASPALHGDIVVVQWDHERESFIAALDKNSGKELWRRDRDEVSGWSTPLIVEHEGRSQVITTGLNNVTSYDLETGEIVWSGPGLTLNAIPSPIEKDGIVYVTSGFRGNAAFAVRLSEAKGDITGTSAILWQIDRDTPYVPSPLLYEDILYLVKSNSGILTARDAKTGKAHYGPVRLEGIFEIYASPVGVNGRVYILGRDGTALVLDSGPELKILATNSLDDGFDASPAIIGDEMYLRGYRHLYRISEN